MLSEQLRRVFVAWLSLRLDCGGDCVQGQLSELECVGRRRPDHVQLGALPALRLVLVLGGIALFIKALSLFRKSSEGLGLTQQQLRELSDPTKRKGLPDFPMLAAQLLQDFGAGAVLIAPMLQFLAIVRDKESGLPLGQVFCFRGVLVAIGWSVRYLRSSGHDQT